MLNANVLAFKAIYRHQQPPVSAARSLHQTPSAVECSLTSMTYRKSNIRFSLPPHFYIKKHQRRPPPSGRGAQPQSELERSLKPFFPFQFCDFFSFLDLDEFRWVRRKGSALIKIYMLDFPPPPGNSALTGKQGIFLYPPSQLYPTQNS